MTNAISANGLRKWGVLVSTLALVATLGSSAHAQEPTPKSDAPPSPTPLPPPPAPSAPPSSTPSPAPNGAPEGAATAQPAATTTTAGKRMRVGADLELALPIGNLSDVAGFGFGALGRFEYGVIDRLAVTGRIGFVYHLTNEIVPGVDSGISYIPIRAGVKYSVLGDEGLYVAGELALNYIFTRATVSVLGQNVDASSSDLRVGFGPSVGYRLDKLDFRGGMNVLSLGDFGDTIVLTVNAGYTFAEL